MERLYTIWRAMKRRCSAKKDQAYPSYGGRGIYICDSWFNYLNFKEWSLKNGYSPELTIDRINNDGGYSPDNCRWVSRKQQARNRRSSCFVTIDGKSKTLAEWAELYGNSQSLISARINKLKWKIEDAIKMPTHKAKLKE